MRATLKEEPKNKQSAHKCRVHPIPYCLFHQIHLYFQSGNLDAKERENKYWFVSYNFLLLVCWLFWSQKLCPLWSSRNFDGAATFWSGRMQEMSKLALSLRTTERNSQIFRKLPKLQTSRLFLLFAQAYFKISHVFVKSRLEKDFPSWTMYNMLTCW